MTNKIRGALTRLSKWLKFVIGATGSLKQNTRPRITAALHTNAEPSEAAKEIAPSKPRCIQESVLAALSPSTPTIVKSFTAQMIANISTQRKDVKPNAYQLHLEGWQHSSWTRRMATAEFAIIRLTSTSTGQTRPAIQSTTSNQFQLEETMMCKTFKPLTLNATFKKERQSSRHTPPGGN